MIFHIDTAITCWNCLVSDFYLLKVCLFAGFNYSIELMLQAFISAKDSFGSLLWFVFVQNSSEITFYVISSRVFSIDPMAVILDISNFFYYYFIYDQSYWSWVSVAIYWIHDWKNNFNFESETRIFWENSLSYHLVHYNINELSSGENFIYLFPECIFTLCFSF